MGWALCWQRGISWDFRSVLEGRFEILYDKKGSIGKILAISGGFGT